MTGQFRKDPFHVNRDVVNDNLTIVRKLRLPRGAQIRARRMFATATLTGGITNANVTMPYAGNIFITVVGPAATDTVTINNPFITGVAGQPIVLSGAPAGGSATLGTATAGQVILTINNTVAGVYIVSVGQRNDRRKNPPFAQ